LITAGIYNADPDHKKNIWKHCLGLLLGDLWGFIGCSAIAKLAASMNADAAVYLVLFVLGIIAVLVATAAQAYVFLPGWLGGWAIGMTILNLTPDPNQWVSIAIQIAISMIVGVLYVGAFLNWVLQKLTKK
jgi:hypothetical protein